MLFVLPVLFWCLHLLSFHIPSCLWVFSRHCVFPVLHLCVVIPSSLRAPCFRCQFVFVSRDKCFDQILFLTLCLCLIPLSLFYLLNDLLCTEPDSSIDFCLFLTCFSLESCIRVLVQCVSPCHSAASHFFCCSDWL